MKNPVTAEMALERLECLCARSEQCTSEIVQKLYKWGVRGAEAMAVVDKLVANRFVDDQRFASAFVRDKYRFARWGRNKIVSHLIQKRIPRNIINNAVAEIDAREYAMTAFALIEAKLRTLPMDMSRTDLRMRLLRFGVGRGYESQLIIKILDSERLWLSRQA